MYKFKPGSARVFKSLRFIRKCKFASYTTLLRDQSKTFFPSSMVPYINTSTECWNMALFLLLDRVSDPH